MNMLITQTKLFRDKVNSWKKVIWENILAEEKKEGNP